MNRFQKKSPLRSSKGQVLTSLMLVIGLFITLALGLLTFEMARYALAKEQLKACIDAATLTAGSTLAMYTDPTGGMLAHNKAESTALKMFQKNSILGVKLTLATLTNTLPLNPGPAKALLHVEFDGTYTKVTGAFGVVPVFGKFLGLGTVPVQITATGGVPKIDVCTCFDLGGSMDDGTNVTFVRRYWDPDLTRGDDGTRGGIRYEISINPGSGVAQGLISRIMCANETGINANVTYPQNLENANQAGTADGHPNPNCGLLFSESDPTTKGLRGTQDRAYPPGNTTSTRPGMNPGNGAQLGTTQTFTDMVVNGDGNTQFGGIVYKGFNFPTVASLVEASRGNLERSGQPYVRAGLDLVALGNVVPRDGYQEAYWDMAVTKQQPFYTAKQATIEFNDSLRKNPRTRLGLIVFTDTTGTGPYSQFIEPNVSVDYRQAGSGSHLNSYVQTQAIPDWYFAQVKALAIPSHLSGEVVDMAEALNKAVQTLVRDGRPGAKKVIVLVTSFAPRDPNQQAALQAAAAAARDSGVSIYIVGIVNHPAIQTAQPVILGPGPSGVVGICGQGSRYLPVNDLSELNQAFGTLARNFVQLGN